MKNIVVISDTHGSIPDNEILWEAFDNADCIFHLGDGRNEIAKLREIYKGKFYFVYGNCDGMSSNLEQVVEIEGVKIFLTHGHNYKVKSGDVLLQLRGEELGAAYSQNHWQKHKLNGKLYRDSIRF